MNYSTDPFRDRLQGLLPEAPETTTWAGAAASRGQARRMRAVSSGVVAASMAVVGVLGVQWLQDVREPLVDAVPATSAPPSADTASSESICAIESLQSTATLDSVNEATLCVVSNGRLRAQQLDRDEATALIDELRDGRERSGSSEAHQATPTLRLHDNSGNGVVILHQGADSRWLLSDDQGEWLWTPTDASQRTLAEAARVAEGDQSNEELCTTTVLARSSTESLTQGAAKVWLCSSWRYAPPEPLEGGRAAQFVSGTLTRSEECVAQPADEWLIAEYADGTRERLTIPSADCSPGVGSLTTFRDLLLEQRRATDEWASIQVPPLAKPCLASEVDSFMPLDLDRAARVLVCTGEDGVVLPADDRDRLVSELQDSASLVAGTPPRSPVRLALLWPNGERLWLRDGGSPQTFYFVDHTGATHQWRPSPVLQQILERVRITGR